ncbi:hypothetical protein [Kribbella sp. NPDC049584]|uniref:hypothetical protein n=1 Tax=Kribbella sp. NPDC049584 TaxID=3154833 RepID=UPI00344A822E
MDKLSTYKVAWLVGGAERAALVTLVAPAADGRLDIAYKRQRVKVARIDGSIGPSSGTWTAG